MYKIYSEQWESGDKSDFLIQKCLRDFAAVAAMELPPEISVIRDGIKKPRASVPGIFFSVSHSGSEWCCAVSNGEIGLDIQEIRNADTRRMARRFFHPDEIAWLERHENHGADDLIDENFFRLWAYKESYVKFLGCGLMRGLDFFSVVTPGSDKPGAQGVRQIESMTDGGAYMVVTLPEKDAQA